MHSDVINQCQKVPDGQNPKRGQVWNGTTFEDYVPEPPTQDEIDDEIKRDINRLESKAIWGLLKFVSSLDNCPAQLIALKDQIQVERNKL